MKKVYTYENIEDEFNNRNVEERWQKERMMIIKKISLVKSFITYPPSGLGKVLLQLLRYGTVNVLGAGCIARYPEIYETKKNIGNSIRFRVE